MGIKMLMAVTTLPATSHYASPSPKPPPPLAPKPDKDNIKLQKILKRAARRKAAQTYLQPVDTSDKSHSYLSKPFRSSLSPVSEASPDLEHCEHRSRSPRSLQSHKIPGLILPPYRQDPAIVNRAHVVSPYPTHKSFYKGKIEILPKIKISTPQTPAEQQNQAFRNLPQPIVPEKTFTIPNIQPAIKTQELPKFSIPPRFSPSFYTPRLWPGIEVSFANVSTVKSGTFKAPIPDIHIVNVFGVNGPSTDATSAAVPVLETSRIKTPTNEPYLETFPNTPREKTPIHEAPRAKTPTYEAPRAKTPTYEAPMAKTPTYEAPRAKTPTYEAPRAKTPTYEAPRAKTPTYEAPRAKTPTYEAPRAKAPTYEAPRAKTPTYEAPRAKTPTYEAPRAKTPTYEAPRAKTPTYEAPRAKTPTYEAPRAKTPTYEAPRAKTPTYEAPRAKTPTYEATRAKTPTYEAPRAKTPTYEAPRAKTPTYDPPGAKTLINELPQETLTKKVDNTQNIENDDLTVGIGTVEIEIHHAEMTSTSKNKTETESKPSDMVVEPTNQERAKSFPKEEHQLKSQEKAKPPRIKTSGWVRLKKHMIVEEEPPKFPEPESELSQSESQEQNQDKTEDRKGESQKTKGSRANKMWDAVLFQMFAAKGHMESNQESNQDNSKQTQQASPVFSSRLPLLLFRPRFDARKLKEAAERPLKRISNTLIESGLHRKAIDDEELKDFNRTAKGWPTKQKEIS
ncbi:adhesive plaque matrix protein [Scyliorhinus canicula]|uniref:adhesive plaque matrix protein n=1 Tax=Scyliorhinus canicula TaxID=7830 RepID=UPI0018F3C343|nr:adhesive plaque matrix protein [Scyliorhinus canicula]XP_038663642.1 adhesive plaque matrix protein [Scyliorhinus canicula]XP_038663643.1 adhesive plaque matrix protein [Scyliorhinus canicula]XP_038663645.1 adhesive plaque matrix protein [Scyliorhinus canicula]